MSARDRYLSGPPRVATDTVTPVPPAPPEVGPDTKVAVKLGVVVTLGAALLMGATAWWRQDSRIGAVEAGLHRVEKVNCLIAKKLGVEMPDCQP